MPNYLLDEEDVITLDDLNVGVNKNYVIIKLDIPLVDKAKPVETLGRKATSLRVHTYDRRVAAHRGNLGKNRGCLNFFRRVDSLCILQ